MRARTAAESPRLAHGPAPHPPPKRSIASDLKPLRYRDFRCVRGCGAVVSLTEFDALPDAWHVAIPAGKGDPTYTCPLCASAAGLTVAPPAAGAGIARQDLDVVRAAQLAQLAEIRAGLAAFMAELAGDRSAA